MTGLTVGALGVCAVPALAGGASGKLTVSGPLRGTGTASNCSVQSNTLTLDYLVKADDSDVEVIVSRRGKHGPRRAQLATTHDYFVQLVAAASDGGVDRYNAGGEQALTGRNANLGSGAITISSNLTTGGLTAHLVNADAPHAEKLTVKASWHCTAS